MKTLQSVLRLAIEHLEKHQVRRAKRVAEELLAHQVGMKRIELYMHFDRPLQEEELEPFRQSILRARKGEPLEYILAEIPFFQTRIRIRKGALIPRPETEILLDSVCKKLDGTEKRALDLCTGSGCLAVGLKHAQAQLDITGVDISTEALAIARENSDEIRWLEGDLTAPVTGETFDLILCNPPYVTEQEYESLDPSVKNFEPKIALVSGPSGYEFYERLREELPSILNPGGKVFFEMGTGQGKKILSLFSSPLWEAPHVEPDWAGHDRFFWAKISS